MRRSFDGSPTPYLAPWEGFLNPRLGLRAYLCLFFASFFLCVCASRKTASVVTYQLLAAVAVNIQHISYTTSLALLLECMTLACLAYLTMLRPQAAVSTAIAVPCMPPRSLSWEQGLLGMEYSRDWICNQLFFLLR